MKHIIQLYRTYISVFNPTTIIYSTQESMFCLWAIEPTLSYSMSTNEYSPLMINYITKEIKEI